MCVSTHIDAHLSWNALTARVPLGVCHPMVSPSITVTPRQPSLN